MEQDNKISTRTQLLREVEAIRDTVDTLEEYLDEMRPKSTGKRIWQLIWQSAIRGFGFVLGTTILAGITLFLLANLVQADFFQNWIDAQMQEFLNSFLSEIEN